jgi:hypothetical protein
MEERQMMAQVASAVALGGARGEDMGCSSVVTTRGGRAPFYRVRVEEEVVAVR